MKATVMYGARDVRVETVPDARLIEPTDALVRVTRACICGSDLWPYNSMPPTESGNRMGHEFIGIVEAVGVRRPHGEEGRPGRRSLRVVRRHLRVLPAGTADVLPAWRMVGRYRARRRPGRSGACPAGGWHAGRASRRARPRADAVAPDPLRRDGHRPPRGAGRQGPVGARSVAVVGDGAVGLCGVIAARRLGAEQIIMLGRHPDRIALARTFGATDVVSERGDAAIERVRELTGGLGAHSVLECVGHGEAMRTAVEHRARRRRRRARRRAPGHDHPERAADLLRQHHHRRRTGTGARLHRGAAARRA